MKALTLSVVIPTFNRAASLRATLDGLARQDYAGAWEAVVVSDGSTDDTGQVVREYAAPYPLRLLEQANGGPARARNRGVAEAAGEVIVFTDDDVEPSPGFVGRHAAHHENVGNLAVIGPMLPDPTRREPVWIAWEHAMLAKQYDAWRTGEWAGVGPHHFYSGNASVRRDHLLAVRGFDENYGRQEDVELAGRLEAECGVAFRYDAAAVGTHRPLRTWEGWLKVPFAYGALDVARARADGGRTFERVTHGYRARNRATRLLADLCLRRPAAGVRVRAALLAAATSLYAAGRRGAALSALSAIYNVRYLEGAADALGTASLLRLLAAPGTVPATRKAVS